MRPRLGRRMVRTAVVGGAAYAVGSHAASKSAAQQQQDANQNAQINDLQQQQQQAAMLRQLRQLRQLWPLKRRKRRKRRLPCRTQSKRSRNWAS